jgi:hypothetical protein
MHARAGRKTMKREREKERESGRRRRKKEEIQKQRRGGGWGERAACLVLWAESCMAHIPSIIRRALSLSFPMVVRHAQEWQEEE